MKRFTISDSEWQVMEAVWEGHPAAASEVIERLAGRADWHPRTVKTLLGRLVRKGVLAFRRDGRRYRYFPRVPRETCVRQESRSFLARFFGGAVAPALVHFVEEGELSREDIRRLKALLERKKGGRP